MTEPVRPQFSSKKCPASAAFVVAMREAFGDVEVIALRENGYEYDPEGRLNETRPADADTSAR